MIEYKYVDSKEKAYWLGFLMADGNIDIKGVSKAVNLSLKTTDLEHLEKFHKFSGTNANIRIRKRERKGTITEIAELSIGSFKLYDELLALGLTPRKSKEGTFVNMSLIPENLHKSFYLGYFDGDGHINLKDGNSVWCFNGENYEQFVQFLQSNRLAHYKLYSLPTKTGVNQVKIRINRQITTTLLEYLYEEEPVFLQRKYMTFCQSKQNKHRQVYYWNGDGSIIRTFSPDKQLTLINFKNFKDYETV